VSPSDPKRLELAVRGNKGRAKHPHYLTELSHFLNLELRADDVFDLPETDRLWACYFAQAVRGNNEPGFALKQTWNRERVDAWLRACQYLGEKLCRENAILFAGPYEYGGAFRVRAEQALNAAITIL
jgi:hypothetical protein